METFKRVMLFLLAGAILGVIAGTLITRAWVPWFNEAEMAKSTVCDLPDVTRKTIDKLVRGQLIGGGIGAVVGIAAGVTLAQRRKRPAAPAAPQAPPGA